MIPILTILAGAAAPGFPPSATTLDSVFAFGAIVLLIGLIGWQSTQAKDPPSEK